MRNVTMPWGKYRGCDLCDVPAGYLAWALEECDNVAGWLRAAMANELAERFRYADEPTNLPAADVEGAYRTMALKYHPDRGGCTEAMQAINEFYAILRQVTG